MMMCAVDRSERDATNVLCSPADICRARARFSRAWTNGGNPVAVFIATLPIAVCWFWLPSNFASPVPPPIVTYTSLQRAHWSAISSFSRAICGFNTRVAFAQGTEAPHQPRSEAFDVPASALERSSQGRALHQSALGQLHREGLGGHSI